MRRYAVVGDPIEHSLSPVMQEAAFDALHIPASYVAIRAGKADAEALVARLKKESYAGFNVTTPLKEAIAGLVDELTVDAQEAEAVNTVRIEIDHLIGHNTDGNGLVRALAGLWRFEPAGKAVLILGSGPAARAIAHKLRAAGANPLWCWSRNAATAAKIGSGPAGAADLLVSTLPANAAVPEEVLSAVNRKTLIFDVNYRTSTSPVPKMIGGNRSDGLPLLLHQGALSFEWWTGLKAPLDVMRKSIGL